MSSTPETPEQKIKRLERELPKMRTDLNYLHREMLATGRPGHAGRLYVKKVFIRTGKFSQAERAAELSQVLLSCIWDQSSGLFTAVLAVPSAAQQEAGAGEGMGFWTAAQDASARHPKAVFLLKPRLDAREHPKLGRVAFTYLREHRLLITPSGVISEDTQQTLDAKAPQTYLRIWTWLA